jgi:hypothetical protein
VRTLPKPCSQVLAKVNKKGKQKGLCPRRMILMEQSSIKIIIDALMLVGVFSGGILTFRQWRKSMKLRRAEFVSQIIEKLWFDKDMVKAIYLIYYEKNWYVNGDFRSRNIEVLVDKYLSYLSYICYLIDMKNIFKEEFSILEYDINKICRTKDVQAYLLDLHGSVYNKNKKKESEYSFKYLIDYGFRKKWLEKTKE